MNVKVKATILFRKEGMSIELKDDDACVMFAKLEFSPIKTMQLFSRLCHVEADNANIIGLNKIGKKMENKKFEFDIPENILDSRYHSDYREHVINYAEKKCPKGWIVSDSFCSQDSFFVKDKKEFARCTIRRWVEK